MLTAGPYPPAMTTMAVIPLFPLHTVLFPGMPLHLHIFEERYKSMIQNCMDRQEEFGVALIQEGREALGPVARPHERGCTARVVQMEKLPEGRMNILTIGQERFEILSSDASGPYLQAEVRLLPLARRIEDETRAQELEPLLQQYLGMLSVRAGAALENAALPQNPEQFAYTCAYLLQMPQSQKQEFLQADSLDELIDRVREQYSKQIELLRVLQQRDLRSPQTPEGYHLN